MTNNNTVIVNERRAHFGIPSRMSVRKFKVENHNDDSFISKCHDFFDSSWVHFLLSGLLIGDIVIIFAELFLGSEFPYCSIIERDCDACCPTSEVDGTQDERWLAKATSELTICQAGYEDIGIPACDDHKWETVHDVQHGLFYCTVIILGIFLLESLVEMATLGRKFFYQIFLVIDFLLIAISLLLELVFHYMKSQYVEVASFLVLIRLWRFVRIGHGIIEVASELTSKQYEPLFEYMSLCEKELEKQNISKPEKTEELQELIEGHLHHQHH